MPLLVLFELPTFLLGLLFGSFLNVCISRLPSHRSVATPRSLCPHCGHPIRWRDNIPLLSFFLLRGRCRDCHAPISPRYPLVELATALWFAAVSFVALRELQGAADLLAPAPLPAAQIAATLLHAVSVATLGFLLLGLLVTDWQTHRLPDTFTLSGILLGFLLVCTEAIFLPLGSGDIKLSPRRNLRLSSPGSFVAKGNVFLTGTEHLVFGRLAAIAGAALLLLLVRWLYFALRGRHRPLPTADSDLHYPLAADQQHAAPDLRFGLGLGDVKLLAMIAAFLGFWPALLAFFLGTILCAVWALSLLARRRALTSTPLPFGSFLAFGGLVTALLGDPILAWYRALL